MDVPSSAEHAKQRIAGKIDGLCDAYVAINTTGKRAALKHINAEIERLRAEYARQTV